MDIASRWKFEDYFKKRYDLNEAAYHQYGSTEKESYFIVIPDKKAAYEYFEIQIPDAESYLKSFASNYKLDAISRKISSVTKKDWRPKLCSSQV